MRIFRPEPPVHVSARVEALTKKAIRLLLLDENEWPLRSAEWFPLGAVPQVERHRYRTGDLDLFLIDAWIFDLKGWRP
ncbi:MAG: hypothetical protein KC656_03870 [Myxococcales bacterium]|nr:hypothetical protein [Myxococcales bacterium]